MSVWDVHKPKVSVAETCKNPEMHLKNQQKSFKVGERTISGMNFTSPTTYLSLNSALARLFSRLHIQPGKEIIRLLKKGQRNQSKIIITLSVSCTSC